MNSLNLFLALLLTIVIEGIVMLLLTRSFEWVKFNLYVNLVTNPTLNLSFWLIFTLSGTDHKQLVYVIGEIIVVIAETLFYKLMGQEDIRKCFWRSAATNAVSVMLGMLILS